MYQDLFSSYQVNVLMSTLHLLLNNQEQDEKAGRTRLSVPLSRDLKNAAGSSITPTLFGYKGECYIPGINLRPGYNTYIAHYCLIRNRFATAALPDPLHLQRSFAMRRPV